MNREEIAVLAELVRRRCGVVVAQDRAYLIENRLAPVARREGFDSIRDLILTMAETRDDRLIGAVVEAMISHETSFFRDRTPFEQFRSDILPVLAGRREPIRLCSLGCSTGQEAYSLAMLLDEERGNHPGLRADILGCDVAERCLEKAQTGLYTQFEVQRGLPARLLVKHFDRQDETWAISPRIRQMVQWSRVNLLNGIAGLGRFDAIFCRNVLSSFDETTRKAVLEQIARAMPESAFLVLGISETAMGLTDALRPVNGRRGLYVLNPLFKAAA